VSDRREQPNNTPSPSRVKALTPRAIAFGGVILALVAAGVVALLLTLGISSNQLDAIRTGGTLVVGAGGAVALLLAARRQRSTELELEQKYEAAVDARTDATERRITELYIKAADQLGSDKAPVRLAGLYALERLAQGTPHLRQTIVNVICAYLRMPYILPANPATIPRPLGIRRKIHLGRPIPPVPQPMGAPQVNAAGVARQEREVRLTAQAILTTHLRPGPDHDQPVETFWDCIDLDLTDATLVDLYLHGCRIGTARFGGAQFTGDAWFSGAQFTQAALFSDAQFTGNAWFSAAQFTGVAGFDNAQFAQAALFSDAQFTGNAWFSAAQFTGVAGFDNARFIGNAGFGNARFTGNAGFGNAHFTGDAWFSNAHFTGDAWFSNAHFTSVAEFNRAQFAQAVLFVDAQFTGNAKFVDAQFQRGRPPELNRKDAEPDRSDTSE
jgi:hypothetical protein